MGPLDSQNAAHPYLVAIRNRVVAPIVARANRAREEAGLPPIGVAVTPHTLRRTYISLMLAAGAKAPYVQARSGMNRPEDVGGRIA